MDDYFVISPDSIFGSDDALERRHENRRFKEITPGRRWAAVALAFRAAGEGLAAGIGPDNAQASGAFWHRFRALHQAG
jgi:hypothetical protein